MRRAVADALTSTMAGCMEMHIDKKLKKTSISTD
jgi:hypothetical protein